MNRLITPMLFVGLSFSLFGQSKTGTFLGSAVSDPEVKLLENQAGFMQEENFNLPWFRDVEVRIRTNDTQPDLEDYRFRLEFLNPLERSANKRYNESYLVNLERRRDVVFSDVLYLRYLVLVDHYQLTSEINEYQDLLKRLDGLLVLAKNEGDAETVLRLDIRRTKLTFELEASQKKLELLKTDIDRLAGQALEFDWENSGMIGPVQMESVIGEIDSLSSPVLLELESRLELAQKELKLEKASARRAIGFIQSEYDSDRGAWPRDHWGFQVGINIPIVNPDKPDIKYERLDVMELESASQKMVREFERNLNKLELDFRSQKSQYERLMAMKTELDSQSAGSAGLILELFDYSRELDSMARRLEMDLLKTYLQVLHSLGRFNEFERVNFLSPGLETY